MRSEVMNNLWTLLEEKIEEMKIKRFCNQVVVLIYLIIVKL